MTSRIFGVRSIGRGVASLQIASDDAPHVRLEDLSALRDVFAEASRIDGLRALVLEGGERHFCAGATRDTLLRSDAAAAIHELVGEVARLVLAIPVPTVAAMAGHAVGGGLMLGLWCDAAIFAEDRLYSANFVSLGFTPGMGATAVLPEVFGAPLARELLLTGRALTGAELRSLAPSIAHCVAPRRLVRERAVALAEEMAAVPPTASRLFKAHLAARRRATLEAALAEERRMHDQVYADPSTRASIDKNYP